MVIYERDGSTYSVMADCVILAVGMKPKRAESDSFIGLADVFFSVGDCNAPRLIEWATKEGYYAAMNL